MVARGETFDELSVARLGRGINCRVPAWVSDSAVFDYRFRIAAPKLLAGISLCVGITLLSGCHRRTSSSPTGQYWLEENSSLTLLMPPGLEPSAGKTQISELSLGAFPDHLSPEEITARCSIHGLLFGLAPSPGHRRWTFQFPSAEGWSAASAYESAGNEWTSFLRELTERSSSGCFGKDNALSVIQERLVAAMPFPADEALVFYYSLGSFGLVDLHPGMQIKFESSGTVAGSTTASEKALLTIQDRSPVGVSLVQSRSRRHSGGDAGATASKVLKTFAEHPFLRLVLAQETPGTNQKRPAMLLGARTRDACDELAGKIMRDGERECVQDSLETACFVFSNGTLSLLSTVTVNGRATLYAPGVTLSQVIGTVSPAMYERAIETVTVERPYLGNYRTIRFERTRSEMSKLILINGDRISWK
jgi:hypothetical protein